jgi:hypothetical protein
MTTTSRCQPVLFWIVHPAAADKAEYCIARARLPQCWRNPFKCHSTALVDTVVQTG